MNANRKAFLDMIAFSEGTAKLGDNGYNVIVGGTLFDDYSDHPRKLITLNARGLKSTAAGRYQLLARYFDAYKKQLNLPDFSPESQDAIAIQQIKECGALVAIDTGEIPLAIGKCKRIWASLPGAGYGQREVGLDDLLAAYEKAGGSLA
jgi:muramidase (phage lysozyme)